MSIDASLSVDLNSGTGKTNSDDTKKRQHVRWDEDKHTPLPLYDKCVASLYLPSATTNTNYLMTFDKQPATGRIWSLLNLMFVCDDEFSATPTNCNGVAVYAGLQNQNPTGTYTPGQFAGNFGDLIYANRVTVNTPAEGLAAPALTTFPADSRMVGGNQKLYAIVNFTGNVATAHGYFIVIEYADWPMEGKVAQQVAGRMGRHPSHHHPSLEQNK